MMVDINNNHIMSNLITEHLVCKVTKWNYMQPCRKETPKNDFNIWCEK